MTNRDFNEDRAVEIEQEFDGQDVAELVRTVIAREPFWSNTEVSRYVKWQLVKDTEAAYV